MSVIFKYRLDKANTSFVAMPKGAKLLHVAYQPLGGINLWALVDPGKDEVQRRLHIIGTGWRDPGAQPESHWAYVGTVHEPAGGTLAEFIWHVFDGGEAP